MDIKTVGVVGAGTMGNGIAQVFAQAGFTRAARRRRAADARSRARDDREEPRQVRREGQARRPPTATPRSAACRRRPTLDDLADADYVVEAIVENAEAKRALFASLDAIAGPDAILASNTSSISITLLGAATKRPDKVLGMHFMNPVPLMTLVELIRGQATSDESMRDRVGAVRRRSARRPVEAADYPGFIANRILMPMINEAIFAVMEGVGTPEAIDTVMKLGMNHPMGPLTLADFIGLDVCLAILERPARRPRRSEVPAVPAAAPDGRRGPARPQVGPGLLHVPSHSTQQRSGTEDRQLLARSAEQVLHHRSARVEKVIAALGLPERRSSRR